MTADVKAGRLVLAGTPLGRVSDASDGLRAALTDADVIAAEDTRRLHRLVADLGVTISAPVISYYESVEQSRILAVPAVGRRRVSEEHEGIGFELRAAARVVGRAHELHPADHRSVAEIREGHRSRARG